MNSITIIILARSLVDCGCVGILVGVQGAWGRAICGVLRGRWAGQVAFGSSGVGGVGGGGSRWGVCRCC